ncbi:RND family efflux transporter MFP subunit [Parabacteroides sp. PF5-5]|nr:RND family efflux transporter MFP subunit [Parabacteroides sp. PH5-39]MDH6315589.1 RND family efflux transporter MFP subunit [Parabacteroides sp. PF5-13]MDH6319250.1 RND family efflux transporter MFP subunit [Parabacteroides sp. PH5-13]MDH6322981.1 RND family efflux transporter MFP subunit [Parabacteroides sp. PH5-8]MDH6326782.1 RND family efflux transporter MFP subunit [Parabacteroides sp. PH5-41]MDH6334789.1 RND family efflux transporter MFP subunit [Parabacteroides sp. PF5-5]MDH6345853.
MRTKTINYKDMKTSNVFKFIPVAAFAILLSCAGEKKETTTVEEKVKVKVETVNKQDVEQLSEFTATVEAHVTNQIAPQSPVRIARLHVEVGDHVRAGQALATMDDTSLKQAKIQMDNQEIEFNRIDELYKVGGASKSAWDAQKTVLEVSRTSYKNLEENSKLLSPVTGIVTARNYDNGDMYSGANPVYVVEQIRPVKLMVNVSESFFTQVKKGMDVDVKLDVYGNEVFKGKVNLVYPTIDPSTRTFPVEIRVNNNDERVRPGMFARVTMNFGSLQHVVAPDQAIVKQAGSGDRYIYVYKNGTVSYQKVELGRRMGNRYEVISGVEDGNQVVITGHNRLTNGMSVEVIN